MTTATEFAQAVRDEQMDFDDALLDYLIENHPGRIDLSFFMTVKVVIGWAAMGQWEKSIALSDTEEFSVREIIERFGLGPFVEP